MRLRTVDPPLPDTLLDALAELNIRTDADLIFYGTPMELYRKLPLGTVTLADLAGHIERVVEYVAAAGTRGDILLEREVQHKATYDGEEFSSGVPQLDELLHGFGGSRVIEISGDRGSGKTSLALQVVMRRLCSSATSTALWVDATGDFSADRVLAMQERLNTMPAAASAADRLQVSLAFDIEAMHEVLETLRASSDVEHQLEPDTPRVRCVVIDNITPIFRPLLSVVSSQGHAIMTTFMRQLRSFARTYGLSILVLNGTSAAPPRNPLSVFASTVRKPALGPTFTFMSDATLWLAKVNAAPLQPGVPPQDASPTYLAEVFRSKHTLSRTWCSFKIRDGILQSE